MHLRRCRFLIVATTLLVASSLGALGTAEERDEFSQRLLLVSTQVDKTEKEISNLKTEYTALVSERKQLEGTLKKNREEEKRLIESLRVLVQKKAQLKRNFDASQQELARREAKVRARVRALYVSSVYHSFGDVLFHTRGDEVERIAVYAKALKNHDEALFKDLRISVDKATKAEQELDTTERSERDAQELLLAKKSELESAIQRTKTVGEEVVKKKKSAERALLRLREEADHLESLLEQLTKSEEEGASNQETSSEDASDREERAIKEREISTPGGTPAPLATAVPTGTPALQVKTPSAATPGASPPTNEEEVTLLGLFGKGKSVQPPLLFRILQPFGKGKGTSFADIVTSKGVDGEAEVGARVEAMAAGRVAFVGPMPGFGTVVILDHGKRHYSLYGRLGESMVSKGMLVPARRVLGTTGQLSEKGRNFYLEVRKDGVAVDPAGIVKGLR